MFVVTVTFVAKADRQEAMKERLIEQARASLTTEPHCLRFDVVQSTEDPCTFFLYEIYRNAAAFETHLASSHFNAFNQQVTPWVADKQVQTWHLCTTP